MNVNQAKKDAAARLTQAGIPFQKLTARTVNLIDLARATPIFVTIHGARYASTGDVLKRNVFGSVPRPSEGGYAVNFSGCYWNGSTVACTNVIS